MGGAGPRLGVGPFGLPPRSVAEVTSTPCAGLSTASASGRVGIEPVAVQADIIFAAVDPLDREPVDEIGIGRAAEPGRQRDPGRERLRPPGEPADRALDPRPRLGVEPVGRVLDHRLEPLAERDQRPKQPLERLDRRRGRLDQAPVELGQLGLDAVAARPARWRGRRPSRAPRRAVSRPARTPCLRRSAAASRRRAARRPPRPPARAPRRRPRHRRRRPSAARRGRAAGRATVPSGPRIQRLSSIASCPVSAAAKVESAASNR